MPVLRISLSATLSAFSSVLLAAALAAAPAQARDDQDDDTVVLPTRGVDLASASGRAEMMRRIEHAARQVCDERNRVTSEDRVLFKQCHDDAVADASRQVDVLVARTGTATLFAEAGTTPR